MSEITRDEMKAALAAPVIAAVAAGADPAAAAPAAIIAAADGKEKAAVDMNEVIIIVSVVGSLGAGIVTGHLSETAFVGLLTTLLGYIFVHKISQT
jgi:hypothetical protein